MKLTVSSKIFQINVIVQMQEELVQKVASSIKPIRPNFPTDNTVDEQALADYNSFIQNSIEEIEDLGLEVIEENASKKSEASRYFALIDVTQDIERTAKYLIFLRISDHYPVDRQDDNERVDDAIRYNREYLRKKYSDFQGHRIKWKVRQIIVNGTTFDNYADALEEVKRLAKIWSAELRSNS